MSRTAGEVTDHKAPNLGGSLAGTRTALSAEEERIRGGVLRHVREAAESGSSLPGELELVERLGCTRKQVRDALAVLELQGIVHRRQGAATEVDGVALKRSVRFEDQVEHSDLLRQLGFESRVEVLSTEEIVMPRQIAGLLTRDASDRAVRTVKRWWADDEPAMIAFNTVPLPQHDVEIDTGESVFASVQRLWSEPVVWDVATPSVALLDAEQSALMQLPTGAPVMTMDLIGIGTSGRHLFHAFELHNPRIVSYSMVRTIRPPWAISSLPLHHA
jgi:DNA-binding GntR family transcriptional regulator